ncbi:hypothetical protein D3C87_1281030 [compost metagenome]
MIARSASISFSGLLASHSQITMTRQPKLASSTWTFWSRASFDLNLDSQKVIRDLGVLVALQPGCRCQKHPWTKTTVPRPGNERSGFPGSLGSCSLKRKPILWAARRTRSSGFVSREPIFAIKALRCGSTGGASSFPGPVIALLDKGGVITRSPKIA